MSQNYLLCTDLDRTLLPNGAQSESENARDYFKKITAFSDVTLAYVSGRDLILIKKAIEEYSLPCPDYAVCDVGTTIYRITNGQWQLLTQWHESIAPDWNQQSHAALASLLYDMSDLHLQEWEKQNTYKLSYYVAVSSGKTEILEEMSERLFHAGIKASIIWSIDEEMNMGLIDVIPSSATKKHAVDFLKTLTCISNSKTLFAGDSGNDLPVLISDIPSVLVANSMQDVKQEALVIVDDCSTQDALYIAKGNYLGMNGNYAAGILEGLSHYYPELTRRLEKSLCLADEESM